MPHQPKAYLLEKFENIFSRREIWLKQVNKNITDKQENIYKDVPKLKQENNISEVVYKFIPRKTDLNKIIKVIKIFGGSHLTMTIKEIQAGYLTSHNFKNIYLYLPKISYPLLMLH